MNLYLFVFLIIMLYIADIFFLIWVSGKFVNVQPLNFSKIFPLGVAILMLSWLTASAFYYAPLMAKPVALGVSGAATIYIFVLMLKTHILKAIAAGLFFVLCQFLLLLLIIRQFWDYNFFQLIKYMMFRYM